MDIEFCKIFKDKGYYESENNEIKRIDLFIEALKCQKEMENIKQNKTTRKRCFL